MTNAEIASQTAAAAARTARARELLAELQALETAHERARDAFYAAEEALPGDGEWTDEVADWDAALSATTAALT